MNLEPLLTPVSMRGPMRCMLLAAAIWMMILPVGPSHSVAGEMTLPPGLVADLRALLPRGGEVHTPNLDSLAAGGLRYTQFYNTARCWPTRAALLTGYYAQQVRRDTVEGVESGGRGKRPAWAPLLPALLKPLGLTAIA